MDPSKLESMKPLFSLGPFDPHAQKGEGPVISHTRHKNKRHTRNPNPSTQIRSGTFFFLMCFILVRSKEGEDQGVLMIDKEYKSLW